MHLSCAIVVLSDCRTKKGKLQGDLIWRRRKMLQSQVRFILNPKKPSLLPNHVRFDPHPCTRRNMYIGKFQECMLQWKTAIPWQWTAFCTAASVRCNPHTSPRIRLCTRHIQNGQKKIVSGLMIVLFTKRLIHRKPKPFVMQIRCANPCNLPSNSATQKTHQIVELNGFCSDCEEN